MGWTASVGSEVAIDEHFSVKAEYAYTSLTENEVHFTNVTPS